MQRSASSLRPTARSRADRASFLVTSQARGNRGPALVVPLGPCSALRDNQPPVRDDVRLTSALAIGFDPGEQRRGQIVLAPRGGDPSPDGVGYPARKPDSMRLRTMSLCAIASSQRPRANSAWLALSRLSRRVGRSSPGFVSAHRRVGRSDIVVTAGAQRGAQVPHGAANVVVSAVGTGQIERLPKFRFAVFNPTGRNPRHA